MKGRCWQVGEHWFTCMVVDLSFSRTAVSVEMIDASAFALVQTKDAFINTMIPLNSE